MPACLEFGISNAERLAAFLGQMSWESRGFSRLEESFAYRTPADLIRVFGSRVKPEQFAAQLLKAGAMAIANHVYANRLGNRDSASGDGWRYRGRGLTQLTGAANYLEVGHAMLLDLHARPDLAADPQNACRIAAYFWASRGCNELADRATSESFAEITRKINGPKMHGHDRRSAAWRQFRTALVHGGNQ